jgi:hypothetical protein
VETGWDREELETLRRHLIEAETPYPGLETADLADPVVHFEVWETFLAHRERERKEVLEPTVLLIRAARNAGLTKEELRAWLLPDTPRPGLDPEFYPRVVARTGEMIDEWWDRSHVSEN